jgi:phospholipid/cholesterol/gamma-HCH transport system ATP-binding protein
MDEILRISNLSLTLSGIPVFNQLNLSLHPGETIALMGKSGAGKTQLLRVIAGLQTPDAGEVVIVGKQISKSNYLSNFQEVSLVFQDSALFDQLTVWENMGLALLENSNQKPSEIRKQVEALGERLGILPEWMNRYPYQLSGGSQKRVAIGRAMMTQPQILLIDEPTAGLDPENAHAIDFLIKELAQNTGVSSIIATHDWATVQSIADKIVWLENGNWAFMGTVEEGLRSNLPGLKSYQDRIQLSTKNV